MPITETKITTTQIQRLPYFKIQRGKRSIFFPAVKLKDATGVEDLYPIVRSPADITCISKSDFFKPKTTQQQEALAAHNQKHYAPSDRIKILDFDGKDTKQIREAEKQAMLDYGFAFNSNIK